jgi:hypothetical protein
VALGVGLLTVAALACQSAVSLMIWRSITLDGAAVHWLRRALDRRVLAAAAAATVVVAFLGASELAHVAGSAHISGHHAVAHRPGPDGDGSARL